MRIKASLRRPFYCRDILLYGFAVYKKAVPERQTLRKLLFFMALTQAVCFADILDKNYAFARLVNLQVLPDCGGNGIGQLFLRNN